MSALRFAAALADVSLTSVLRSPAYRLMLALIRLAMQITAHPLPVIAFVNRHIALAIASNVQHCALTGFAIA